MGNNKFVGKVKGLTLHFVPFGEISKLETVDRIKKLLRLRKEFGCPSIYLPYFY